MENEYLGGIKQQPINIPKKNTKFLEKNGGKMSVLTFKVDGWKTQIFKTKKSKSQKKRHMLYHAGQVFHFKKGGQPYFWKFRIDYV